VLARNGQRELSVVKAARLVDIVLIEEGLQGGQWVVHARLLEDAHELLNVDGARVLLVKVLEHAEQSLVLSLLRVATLPQLLLQVFFKSERRCGDAELRTYFSLNDCM
jgi:hypothetical protein